MHAIGTAAKRSGVGIEAIRYYERAGVVPRAQRAANGRRVYDDDAIRQLRFVRRCRDLGFTIADVKTLLSLSATQPGSCARARAVGETHRDAVRRKIADLQLLEAALSEQIRNCAEGSPTCPMLQDLFAD